MLIMWYRNLFIKITYMYSSLLKRRLQRVVLRITTAPRSRWREAAGSARGPDPAPGRAAEGRGGRGSPARPGGGSVSGAERAHREQGLPSPPGQATPRHRGVRRGQEPSFLGGYQLRGGLRVTFPSHGGKSRLGVCGRSSCPRPSLPPTPGPASPPGPRLRSLQGAGENPAREPSFRRADVLTPLWLS